MSTLPSAVCRLFRRPRVKDWRASTLKPSTSTANSQDDILVCTVELSDSDTEPDSELAAHIASSARARSSRSAPNRTRKRTKRSRR
ncbi:hypothetical protein BDZ89DRAFT_421087 [Hymenopellis radicata]|nr:hypothetical protein BDZ89DRAFT_421087 [Hymenopellis radicata]